MCVPPSRCCRSTAYRLPHNNEVDPIQVGGFRRATLQPVGVFCRTVEDVQRRHNRLSEFVFSSLRGQRRNPDLLSTEEGTKHDKWFYCTIKYKLLKCYKCKHPTQFSLKGSTNRCKTLYRILRTVATPNSKLSKI